MISRHPHRNLEAWKKSMDLVESIYKTTSKFPQHEQFGLTVQLRRASISVPSNIAEGASSRSGAHFGNYLTIALGSLSELDTQIEIAFRLKYIGDKTFNDISEHIDHCKRLVFGLKKSVLKKKE